MLAMVPVQWSEFTLTRNALATIRVRDELSAPSIVVVKRADLPLTPAATFLLDLMERAAARLKVPKRWDASQ